MKKTTSQLELEEFNRDCLLEREDKMNRPNHPLGLIQFISARRSIIDRSKLIRGITHNPKIEKWEYLDMSNQIRYSRCINHYNERRTKYMMSIHQIGGKLTMGDEDDLMKDAMVEIADLFGHSGLIMVVLTTGSDLSDIRFIGSAPWRSFTYSWVCLEGCYPVLSNAAFKEHFSGDMGEGRLYKNRNKRSAE